MQQLRCIQTNAALSLRNFRLNVATLSECVHYSYTPSRFAHVPLALSYHKPLHALMYNFALVNITHLFTLAPTAGATRNMATFVQMSEEDHALDLCALLNGDNATRPSLLCGCVCLFVCVCVCVCVCACVCVCVGGPRPGPVCSAQR
jgi:hypothetical protein